MASEGTSAIRMRRKAFAMAASTPIRENEASNASFLWKSISRFYSSEFENQPVRRNLLSEKTGTHVSKLLERPRMVFTWPVPWEICGRNVRNGLGINLNNLFEDSSQRNARVSSRYFFLANLPLAHLLSRRDTGRHCDLAKNALS